MQRHPQIRKQFLNSVKSNFLIYFAFFIFSFVLGLGTQVVAHPLDVVYFEIQEDRANSNNFKTCLNIHPSQLKILAQTENLNLSQINSELLFKAQVAEQNCLVNYLDSNLIDNDALLCYNMSCPAVENQLPRFQFEFFKKFDDKFTLIGQYKFGTTEKIFRADPQNPEYTLQPTSSGLLSNFFWLGIEHIGATPHAWLDENGNFQLADGLDHVLFILCLVLMSLNLKSLVLNITGFTIGHCVTLALALGQIFVMPAAYIEPLIAFSIAYLAFKAFRQQSGESYKLTFAFGLLHGMGFSYILGELNTTDLFEFFKTLFYFNLGIEAGQLIIMICALPLFFYVTYKKKASVEIKKIICGLVGLLSLYWFFERALAIFTA